MKDSSPQYQTHTLRSPKHTVLTRVHKATSENRRNHASHVDVYEPSQSHSPVLNRRCDQSLVLDPRPDVSFSLCKFGVGEVMIVLVTVKARSNGAELCEFEINSVRTV